MQYVDQKAGITNTWKLKIEGGFQGLGVGGWELALSECRVSGFCQMKTSWKSVAQQGENI